MADGVARRVRGTHREIRCVPVEGPTVSLPVGPWVASCCVRLLAKQASGSLGATGLLGATGPVNGAFAFAARHTGSDSPRRRPLWGLARSCGPVSPS